MATSSVIFSWGNAIPGRETKGLEVFMSAVQFYTQKAAKKEIESFAVHMAETGNFDTLGGTMIIEGSDEQITTITASADYRQLVVKATHIVSNFTVSRAVTGNAVMQRIEELNKVRAELGFNK